MEPLSVTASIVGITAPTLHLVRRLADDIQNISDAPDTVTSLRGDLTGIDNALTSLNAVSDQQWESLGEGVVNQSKTAITYCDKGCKRLQDSLKHWTRHSSDRKMSWKDRAAVGFFKHNQVKSMSEQLQCCKMTLVAVVGIANLKSSLQNKDTSNNMLQLISTKEAEVLAAMEATNKQITELNGKFSALQLAPLNENNGSDGDRAIAISQVSDEQNGLDATRKLLQELLAQTQAAAAEARKLEGNTTITFGALNKGFQVATNSGTISGITFN